MIKTLITSIFSTVFMALGVVLIVSMSTIFGGLFGFLVGLLFDETSKNVLTTIGSENLTMFEVGATLGFVSGFFKNTSTSTK